MSRNKLGSAKTSAPAKNGAASNDAAPFLRVAAEWKGYVNVELSEAEKNQFTGFINDSDMVQEITAETLLHGYKITVVQVDNPETVKASAFAAFKGMPDAGYTVSAWMGDIYQAIAAVVFLVAIHSQFDLSQHVTEVTGKSRRTF